MSTYFSKLLQNLLETENKLCFWLSNHRLAQFNWQKRLLIKGGRLTFKKS